jgi:hypothetical protein
LEGVEGRGNDDDNDDDDKDDDELKVGGTTTMTTTTTKTMAPAMAMKTAVMAVREREGRGALVLPFGRVRLAFVQEKGGLPRRRELRKGQQLGEKRRTSDKHNRKPLPFRSGPPAVQTQRSMNRLWTSRKPGKVTGSNTSEVASGGHTWTARMHACNSGQLHQREEADIWQRSQGSEFHARRPRYNKTQGFKRIRSN